MTTTTTPVDIPIANRVRRGIAWLDENAPLWRDELDLSTLDIADSNDCVLGQVFQVDAINAAHDRGHYWSGFEYVLDSDRFTDDDGAPLSEAWAARHGFEATLESYAELERAWRHMLSQTSDSEG
jgi:hypothetical protein